MIDTNDHTPDFGNSSFSFDVSEASAPGIVGNVLATDNDFGENGRVTYKISSGDGMDVFDIDTVLSYFSSNLFLQPSNKICLLKDSYLSSI